MRYRAFRNDTIKVREAGLYVSLMLAGPNRIRYRGFLATSEVLGTVRDPSQMAVPKAAVTLTNQDTGIEAKTTTDEAGITTSST